MNIEKYEIRIRDAVHEVLSRCRQSSTDILIRYAASSYEQLDPSATSGTSIAAYGPRVFTARSADEHVRPTVLQKRFRVPVLDQIYQCASYTEQEMESASYLEDVQQMAQGLMVRAATLISQALDNKERRQGDFVSVIAPSHNIEGYRASSSNALESWCFTVHNNPLGLVVELWSDGSTRMRCTVAAGYVEDESDNGDRDNEDALISCLQEWTDIRLLELMTTLRT